MANETMIGDAPTASAAAPAPGAAAPAAQPAASAAAPSQQALVSDPAATANASPAPAAAPAVSAPIERSAPEKYEIKLADNAQVDPDVLGAFEATARELKMPQEEAQKLVAAMAPKIKAQVAAQTATAIAQASAKWETEARADTEFGGDQLPQNLALGEKALSTFGTRALRQLLIESRLGNHPEVIRFMVRAGKALSEDKFVAGRESTAIDPLKVQYPTMFKD